MTPTLVPSFESLLDRAVLSDSERRRLLLLRHHDPFAAGLTLGGIVAGQVLACRMAADNQEG
jgi:hypothetical protein